MGVGGTCWPFLRHQRLSLIALSFATSCDFLISLLPSSLSPDKMFFSKLGKGKNDKNKAHSASSAIPATGSQIRIRKVKVVTKTATPSVSRSGSTTPKQAHEDGARATATTSNTSQKRRKKKTPDLAQFNRVIISNSETDDSAWEAEFNKRVSSTSATPPVETDRRVIYKQDYETADIIESKQLMSFAEYKPCFKSEPNLQYQLAAPCSDKMEKYYAYRPKQEDEYNPVMETELIMDMVARSFVPSKYTNDIKHPSLGDCIVRRYRRALKQDDPGKFVASVMEYNKLITELRKRGEIREHLQQMTQLPLHISRSLLNQVYSRVVSPRANDLREYEAFSNNVYGELLPEFVTRLFHETKLTSDSVFIDLGSGVGNCTLQAALEIGCESWGCEVMKTASDLAARQQHELEERVKLYGLNIGEIQLRSASFVHNDEIQKAVSRADVVLVNNYAFDGKLNSHLIDMFLDLKDGCRIVSLKSFVPPGHVISEHNIESPLNILSVEKKEFPSGSVSWTSTPGPYYLSVVDRSLLQKYFESRGRRRHR